MFNVENNLLLCYIIFKYEPTWIYRLTRDLTDTSVPCERESRRNVIQSFAMSHHVQSYQDSKREQ